ncbi:MAG: EF-Tu/IF-2/RF-3 family GTPase [Armatimonadota bacterium]|nr:translation elongation factor-like protein [bacterium]
MEEKIGKVTHYFNKIGVAAIEIDHGKLHRGDKLHIVGHTTDAEVVVESIEIDHHPIDEANEGQNIGIKVDEHVREHDDVYKAYI